MFDVNGVSFSVDGTVLLHPTRLNLGEGKVYGLIGHNGSGKSTLLKLLAQQQPPTGGHIQLDGRSLADWGSREFARNVAYLPQRLPSAENLTGRELVAFGRFPWRGLLGRLTAEDHRRIDNALALTHTEPFADRLVDTLSGGERQRVWLAMLLAQGSRFLLLDEPLAALDMAHQVEVLELIRKLCAELGVGVIIVLHDINLAGRYCDQLVALRRGRVLARGLPQELMNAQTLEAIYELPMQVMTHPRNGYPVALLE